MPECSQITQGLVVGRLTKLGFDDWTVISGSTAALCLSYGLLALVHTISGFCLACLPMVVAGAVFSTVIQAMITKTVRMEDTGKLL